LNNGSLLATPLLIEDFLIVATLRGTLISVRADNGTVLWRRQEEKPYFSSPIQLCNDLLVVGDVSGLVSFVNVYNGNVNHSILTEEGIFSNITKLNSCVIIPAKNKIICINWKNFNYEWIIDMNSQITSTPFVFANNMIVASLQKLSVINLDNKLILSQISLQREIFSSPIVISGRVVFGCRDNYLHCYKLY